ncbi:MAG TPA: hypothetical protein VGS08_06280 [Candidatus Saccharimonadales bacterium]|nr:hypothetical protein [Candidatus Saccharimonadales bacterium]
MRWRAEAHHDEDVTELGDEEIWAQACIQRELPEVLVEQYDDGSKPGMYDLKIIYPDGTIGAVGPSRRPEGGCTVSRTLRCSPTPPAGSLTTGGSRSIELPRACQPCRPSSLPTSTL